MGSVFVFGSNREGRHGNGAALEARMKWGAKYGVPSGRQGNSYAIVTKELRRDRPPVTLEEVRTGVLTFLRHAHENPQDTFQVTRIGCGLAGFTPEQIAPLFRNAPSNCCFPDDFHEVIKAARKETQ